MENEISSKEKLVACGHQGTNEANVGLYFAHDCYFCIILYKTSDNNRVQAYQGEGS